MTTTSAGGTHVPNMVSSSQPSATCADGVFLPSTGTNTQPAPVVVISLGYLHWLRFSFHQLVQILYLYLL